MINSPLAQFDIITIIPIIFGNFEVSITNLTLTIFIALLIGIAIFYVFYIGRLIPRNWQLILEGLYMFVYRLAYQQMGKSGLVYFPFIFSLFTFILVLNLLSMTPYGFAATSHMIWTVYFSLSICLGIFIMGIIKHQLHFFKLFVP